MNGFFSDLGKNSIITADAVTRLKEHIARKNPGDTVSGRAAILADALNRVLDARLPKLEKAQCGRLKRLLLEQAVKKPVFEVFCSDAFQAAVELKETGEDFFDRLDAWLSANLERKPPKEQLIGLVHEAHRLMTLYPEMEPADTIAVAEEEMAAAWAERKTGMERTAGASSAGYAAARLKAVTGDGFRHPGDIATDPHVDSIKSKMEKTAKAVIAAKKAGRYGPAFGISSAGYAAARLKAIAREKTAVTAGEDGARRSYARPGRFSRPAAKNNALRSGRIPGDWRRMPAVAAAVALLTIALVSGIGRSTGILAGSPGNLAQAAGQNEPVYETTVLEDEAPAAGSAAPEDGRAIRMKATAYDLSVESCGKLPHDPGYGVTTSGTRAQAGRTVAVDPEIIPLGSRLMITFPEEYGHLDGIYTAEDTGRLIKGNAIDIFFGEDDKGSTDINDRAMEFGVRYVDVEILADPEKDAS